MTIDMLKMLFYDLEVSPILGWCYGMYDTRIMKVEQHPVILSVSYRWLGDKEIKHINLSQKDCVVKGDPFNDYHLAEKLRDLLDEADIVVAHNARRFDNKVSLARIIYHKIAPPSPFKTIDTLTVVKQVARFDSNALDPLGEYMELGRKTKTTHHDLWHGCLSGDLKSWKKMESYNNQDVKILYNLYMRLRPYINNHPNVATLTGEEGRVCPKCGSTKVQSRGVRHTNVSSYRRYQCQNCGGWSTDRKSNSVSNPVLTNYS